MNFIDIPIIKVAICIIITWGLFAIVCSYINESIVQLISERGKFMKKYLLQQLYDSTNGINWAHLVYNHGSVDMLSREIGKPASEINPKLFAETLLETVGKAALVQNSLKELDNAIDVLNKIESNEMRKKDPNYNDFNNYEQLQNPILKNFHASTMVLKPSDVIDLYKQAINNAILSAPKTVDGIDESAVYKNLVQYLENWYLQLQGRITLWYKKRTKQRLFYLALVLSLVFNIDTMQLFHFYQNNPTATVSAISFYEKNKQNIDEILLNDSLKAKNAVKDSIISKNTTVTKINTDSLLNSKKGIFVAEIDSLSKSLNLPVGFKHILADYKSKDNKENLYLYLFYKILGLVITAFAASMGAPFWFDLLKKIVSKKI